MKQSELDRDIRRLCKLEGKKLGWKNVGGCCYWSIGPLFFVTVTIASAKEGSFHCSLRFKWLALDRELWRVFDMSENEDAPFSLHANGAFVLRGQELLTLSRRGLSWHDGSLDRSISDAFLQSSGRAKEVAAQIDGLDSYIQFIRHENEALLRRFPGAVVDVHKEELLAALLGKQFDRAREIALARAAAGDSGGLSSNGKSFYESALFLLNP